ncbi:MAG: hypothetical protein KAI79_02460, partial [Bacteroidales bacterium]|nr:hypothetical protein [Bacteroidales bacterium]
DKNKQFFSTFTLKDGLPNNTVSAIEKDKNDNLWIATNKGLSKLIINSSSDKNSISNGISESSVLKFLNLDNEDGLKAKTTIRNALFFGSKNQLWVGGNSHLININTEKLALSTNAPDIKLNSVDIHEEFIDYYSLADSLNKGNINENSNLRDVKFAKIEAFHNYPIDLSLPYYNNHLTFYFSANDWVAPHKIEYQYIIPGIDEKWSSLTKETKADYRNIPHGTFKFKVKAIGEAKKWSETFEYEFTIRPPWWLTWWAKTLWALLILSFLVSIYEIRTKSLKERQKELEKEVSDRTKEVREKNEDLEQQKEEILAQTESLEDANTKLKELDQFKEGMTGMIVHDLKNPLNSIINIPLFFSLERQIANMKQSGKQMLNMVMNILDVYKYEDTEMVVDKSNYSLYELSQNAINEIRFLAEQKNITIENAIPTQTGVQADKEIIERVFVNLLTNAIKYSQNNGKITLQGFQTLEGFIQVSVTDNGQGIPKDKLDSVFDKFEQVLAKKSGEVRSTGLGLTFCKIAVEAHSGEINVESEEGKVTSFLFTLPTGKEFEVVAKTEELVKSNNITLTDEDKNILNPYITDLQNLLVYETSEIEEILNEINFTASASLQNWKTEIDGVLFNMNEEKYTELITSVK